MKSYRKVCWTALILVLTVLFLYNVGLAPSRSIARAYLPDSYFNAVSNEEGDWYFKENYLNIAAVKAVVDSWKTDPDFDFDYLENNPVKIAVVDSGIGCGYKLNLDGTKTEAICTDYYGDGISYQISSFFDDVLLKDSNGKIVYKNVADYMNVKDTTTSSDDGYVYNSGNVAADLADNTQDNHGTHVSSTVGILIKALGLEKYIKIIPIKANTSISKTNGATKYTAGYFKSKVEEAVNFAVNNGADVINLSMASSNSGFSFSENAEKAVIVAAAGNDGMECKRYPAASSDILGVMNYGAESGNPTMSLTSNFGSYYDVCAPGSSITAIIDGENGYGKLSGTSMASPIVSFACALLKMRYRANKELDLTPSMIRTLLPKCSTSNVSRNGEQFKTLDLVSVATADFAADPNYAETIFGTPSAITVSAQSTDVTLGDSLTLSVNYFPLQSVTNGKVVWYYLKDQNEVKFAEGERAVFVPETIGNYSVYCTLEQDGMNDINAQKISVNVSYKPLGNADLVLKNGDNVINSIGELSTKAGNEMCLSVYGLEYVDPRIYSLEWYVNGVIVSTDDDFRFTPDKTGTYEISAKINRNVIIVSLMVNVNESSLENDKDSYTFDDPKKERIGLILGCSFAGLAFLLEIGIAIYILSKKKKQI